MNDLLSQKAFWAALCMGAALPLFGRNLALARSILLGLALPQVSLAGVAFVFMGAGLGWQWCLAPGSNPARAFLGAALFTVPALFLATGRARLPEALLGFLYLAATASANLFLSGNATGEIYTHGLLHGQLLLLDQPSFLVLLTTLAAASLAALLWRRRILLALSDPAFAKASGVRVGLWLRLAALLSGAVITVCVATAGPLVTFAFLVLPVLAAAAFSGSLRTHLAWASLLGAGCGVAGCAVAYRYDLPLGDTLVAAGCAAYLVCKAIAAALPP